MENVNVKVKLSMDTDGEAREALREAIEENQRCEFDGAVVSDISEIKPSAFDDVEEGDCISVLIINDHRNFTLEYAKCEITFVALSDCARRDRLSGADTEKERQDHGRTSLPRQTGRKARAIRASGREG